MQSYELQNYKNTALVMILGNTTLGTNILEIEALALECKSFEVRVSC